MARFFKSNYSERNLARLCVKLFKEQLFWPRPRNTRLPDKNQERRPITVELNLNAVTLYDGKSCLLLTFDLARSKTHLRSAPLPRNAERTSIEFGFWRSRRRLRTGSNLPPRMTYRSLLAHRTAPAASFEGSILLCNDYYRHASAPARSESWGVDDVQVDFTGLASYARIAPHKTGHGSVPHRSALHWPVLIQGGVGASVLSRWARSTALQNRCPPTAGLG